MRTLYPFQETGVTFLQSTPFALLADEQGLGKTTQAIAAVRDYEAKKIIVCPLSLTNQWRDEIFAITGDVATIVSSKGQHPERWTIVSYERVNWLALEKGERYNLIVDEATHIKNWKTKRSKAVMTLAARADRIIALTGTPMVNRPKDLWMLFLLLRKRVQRDFFPFMEKFCGAFRTPYGWDFDGASNTAELGDELRTFMLRREKKTVLPQLPPKTYTTIKIDTDEDPMRKLHDFMLSGGDLLRTDGIEQVMHARIDAANAKVPAIAEWIEAHPDQKIVVFSNFRATLHGLRAELYGLGDAAVGRDSVVTGATPAPRRDALIQDWKTNPHNNILFTTYGVSTYGLNLQEASVVIIMDLPWTPAELQQAEDRVHRIGQENPVEIVTFLTSSPIEAHMLGALREKRTIGDAVLEYQRRGLELPLSFGLKVGGV